MYRWPEKSVNNKTNRIRDMHIISLIYSTSLNLLRQGGFFMIKQGPELRKEVKKRLIDLDMTQQQLANALGIASSYVNDIVLGNRYGEEYLSKILDILGIEDVVLRKAQ